MKSSFWNARLWAIVVTSTTTIAIGSGCGLPSIHKCDKQKEYERGIPSRASEQNVETRKPRQTGLRAKILQGPYSGHGLTVDVEEYDRKKQRGTLSIVSLVADDANKPLSELRVVIDGVMQTVTVNRNMPVPYEYGAVAELFRYFGTDEAVAERIKDIQNELRGIEQPGGPGSRK